MVLSVEPIVTNATTIMAMTKTGPLIDGDQHWNSNGDNKTSPATAIKADVDALCKQGRLKEAMTILHSMDQEGILPYSATYDSLLHACVDKKSILDAKLVQAHIIQTGFKPDIYLGNKLVTVYVKCGSLVDARRILDEMPQRNVVSWTAIIAAYAKHGLDKEAYAMLYEMEQQGIQPNQFTFAGFLPACGKLGILEHGREVHERIIRSGFQCNVFVDCVLLDMYVKCRCLEDARKLFDKMPEKNLIVWNAMISGYGRNGSLDKAVDLFGVMPQRDVVSWTAVIAGYVQIGLVDEAFELFEKMPDRDVVSWNTVIAGYAQNGQVDQALKLFEEMPHRNVISWNSMIAAYARHGYSQKALDLYHEMMQTGVSPTQHTFTGILPACADLAALEQGKEIHEVIMRSGYQSQVFVSNALIDMYAKCGSIEDARNVFDKMFKRDVVSWNAMLAGYAMHGFGKEALQLFEQMQQSDINPDHITFLGILSACCHAGFLDKGLQYFSDMSQYYHITPAAEHYCCMVDLFGRAHCLDKALDFINKMPMKPDAAVWGSLLAACRFHTHVKLAEIAAEHLFDLDPENTTAYVLLSNVYAAAHRWDGIEKVRKMMKDRGVKKAPGCSWIEVNDKVYTFLVGDKSHPQTQKIYESLERLSGQLKEAGYVPDTSFVLQDVDEEQKEYILCHHSEKLAIAFGLINMPSGTPIRIVKNLRVCGDCHSASKFISKIVAREIVVRDAHRFHHFKNGQCSCQDYW